MFCWKTFTSTNEYPRKMLCANANTVHFNPFGVQEVCFCSLVGFFFGHGPHVGEFVFWDYGGCACCFVVLVRVWLVGSQGDGRLGDFNARPDREVTR